MPLQTQSDTTSVKDGPAIREWYGVQARTFGNDFRSLGFNQQASQSKRFAALCELGDFTGQRVLDVGCGLGHFIDYLQENDRVPDYTGVDITPEFIEQAKTRLAGRKNCRFEVADTLEFQPASSYDYVVASGIFGLHSEDAEQRIEPTLRRLFSWAQTGVAVNFLSSRAESHAEGRLYVDPARLLSLALNLTPAVRLNHSYLPNDFTLYLYRTPPWKKTL
jgi:SAM-dependent methyltransferase